MIYDAHNQASYKLYTKFPFQDVKCYYPSSLSYLLFRVIHHKVFAAFTESITLFRRLQTSLTTFQKQPRRSLPIM